MPSLHTVTVITDVSMEGCGGHAQALELYSILFQGLWNMEERFLLINVLDLRAVQLMLLNLKQTL